MNRIFDRFVSKWSTASISAPRHGPETPESLGEVEKAFGVTLPEAYVDFMLSIGEVWTPQILDCVVDQELEMPDIQNILSFEEAEGRTKNWRQLDLPANMFAFATDCMGNMFCFDTSSCITPRPNDLPIFLFDHDFATTKKVADSFLSLLASYADLEKHESHGANFAHKTRRGSYPIRYADTKGCESIVNPTKKTIVERLGKIDEALEPLTAVCERYLRYCSAFDPIGETLLIGHQPWKGPEAYAVNIFPAAKKSWFSKYSRSHGLTFPSAYKAILSSVNGFNAFGLSLYGIPPSMVKDPPLLDRSRGQCLDIGSANVYWKMAFPGQEERFHFGGRNYSYTELRLLLGSSRRNHRCSGNRRGCGPLDWFSSLFDGRTPGGRAVPTV